MKNCLVQGWLHPERIRIRPFFRMGYRLQTPGQNGCDTKSVAFHWNTNGKDLILWLLLLCLLMRLLYGFFCWRERHRIKKEMRFRSLRRRKK
ncbi:MAG: hypothetical protein IKD31_06955 [Clostridia bacterium]|nr:hypothetical protein [Clostridia bacterium]